jgi:predicted nuclease with TOPRIM domain
MRAAIPRSDMAPYTPGKIFSIPSIDRIMQRAEAAIENAFEESARRSESLANANQQDQMMQKASETLAGISLEAIEEELRRRKLEQTKQQRKRISELEQQIQGLEEEILQIQNAPLVKITRLSGQWIS